MRNDPRRQAMAVLVIAAMVLLLAAIAPGVGALEPLDDSATMTSLVETVADETAPVLEEPVEEVTSSTTTSSSTTSSTSTTSTTSTSTTTTTVATGPAAVPATSSSGTSAPSAPASASHDAPLPTPTAADADVGTGPATPHAVNPWTAIDRAGGTGSTMPASLPLPPGPRSTVSVVDLLDGVAAPPSLVAKVLAPFPVAGPATYTNDWLAPRHGGRQHKGTDIFAEHGTPVIASSDGVVERMTTSAPLGGISLRITAAGGTYFYYAHLSRFAPGLADGDQVVKGQVVGFVGNTGNARTTPPHLHFQIHPGGGAPVAPVPHLDHWLADARTRAAAIAGAPAVDALVQSGVRLAPQSATRGAGRLQFEVSEAVVEGRATTLASSDGGAPPIDPVPLVLFLLPAAWVARLGLRELRAWRALR